MAENAGELGQSAWLCPAPGCGKAFTELWRLRQHHRQPTKGTAATRGHGEELLECPRCREPLSLMKNARHRCKMAPARMAAAAAAAAAMATAAAAAAVAAHEAEQEEEDEEVSGEGPLRTRKRRRVRWQTKQVVSGSSNSSGSEYEADGGAAADGEGHTSPVSPLPPTTARVPTAAAAEHEADAGHVALPQPKQFGGQPLQPFSTPRGAAAAEMLVRISAGVGLPMFSPAAPLPTAAAQQAPKHDTATTAAAAVAAAASDASSARWWQTTVQPAAEIQPAGPAAQAPPPVPAAASPPPLQHAPSMQLPQAHVSQHRQSLQLPAQALATTATELLTHLLDLLKQAVSAQDAEEFVSLVIRHTAERQGTALAGAPGAAPGAGGPGAGVLLAGLVAELSVRCNAVRQLLQQQHHQQLAGAVHSALGAARLATAVSQLSALLARQQVQQMQPPLQPRSQQLQQ